MAILSQKKSADSTVQVSSTIQRWASWRGKKYSLLKMFLNMWAPHTHSDQLVVLEATAARMPSDATRTQQQDPRRTTFSLAQRPFLSKPCLSLASKAV